MTLLLILLTAGAIVAFMWRAFRLTRDALHPAIYFGPLFFFSNVIRPAWLQSGGWLEQLFSPAQLVFVFTYLLAGICLFLGGTLWATPARSSLRRRSVAIDLSSTARHRATVIGAVLAAVAVLGFWVGVLSAGGLGVVYGYAKGGFYSTNNYLSEAPIMAFPAIGLLALAWQGRGLSVGRVVALLITASPYLVHGVLGARRGPTFMICMALFVALIAISGRRPRMSVVVAVTGIVGLLIIFLLNNRSRIYLGSDWSGEVVNVDPVYADRGGTGTGDDWAFGAGTILVFQDFGKHLWGWRYLGQLIVQPIPRQLWPTKYADIGLDWIAERGATNGLSDNEWRAAVGWVPAIGSAGGVIADFFMEFSYLGLLACLALGWLYGYLWRKSVTVGGVHSAIYLYAVILSIYIPTQNFNAWYYRFLFMSVPTWLAWWYLTHGTKPSPASSAAPRRAALS